MQTKTPKQTIHIPILLDEVLTTLKPKNGDTYLDLTAGYGGHATAILQKTGSAHATLVDRDRNAIAHLTQVLSEQRNVNIIKNDFYTAVQTLAKEGQQFDIILADLGVSSPHLDIASRGFSITQNGPLDMRMDESSSLTASNIVNTYDEASLVHILRVYGEEPKAVDIARRIIKHRPIETTHELAGIVAQAWPGHSRVHPATRTFQALRIAVNDELQQVEKSLPLMERLLAPDGRLGIITFHSLEDRIVKRYFAEHTDTYDADLATLTKRPIVAGKNELVFNPRARSAKLRAVAKINIKKETIKQK
jgi:16S rRNA (cytosine1402-N4)-methyltransferase